MDIIQAARRLRPNTAWVYDGTLRQADDGLPRVDVPTMDELSPVMNSDVYAEQRRLAYPSLQELADALVHQKMGDNGAALDAYLQKCIAVKAQFPKP